MTMNDKGYYEDAVNSIMGRVVTSGGTEEEAEAKGNEVRRAVERLAEAFGDEQDRRGGTRSGSTAAARSVLRCIEYAATDGVDLIEAYREDIESRYRAVCSKAADAEKTMSDFGWTMGRRLDAVESRVGDRESKLQKRMDKLEASVRRFEDIERGEFETAEAREAHALFMALLREAKAEGVTPDKAAEVASYTTWAAITKAPPTAPGFTVECEERGRR